MSYIGKQVSSVTTRPPQNRLSSSLKKYVHVPRVVHACTFLGTSLYFSLFVRTFLYCHLPLKLRVIVKPIREY